jgi:SAM-dependent methyltransferase
MRDSNSETLAAYEAGWEEYLASTPEVPLNEHGVWLPDALTRRPKGPVLEIGSGPGHDAAHMEAIGVPVIRTDACEGFVRNLRDQGHEAQLLNVLTDDLGGPYGMIYAFAVFQHFDGMQLSLVLRRCRNALVPGGVLAFSARRGLGAEWQERKGMSRRLFCYWSPAELWQIVEYAGLTVTSLHQDTQAGRDGDQIAKTWLLMTAVA